MLFCPNYTKNYASTICQCPVVSHLYMNPDSHLRRKQKRKQKEPSGFFVKQENGDAGSTNGTKDGQNRKFLLLPWPPLLPSCFSHLGGSVNQNDGSEDRKTKPITKLVPSLVLNEEV